MMRYRRGLVREPISAWAKDPPILRYTVKADMGSLLPCCQLKADRKKETRSFEFTIKEAVFIRGISALDLIFLKRRLCKKLRTGDSYDRHLPSPHPPSSAGYSDTSGTCFRRFTWGRVAAQMPSPLPTSYPICCGV